MGEEFQRYLVLGTTYKTRSRDIWVPVDEKTYDLLQGNFYSLVLKELRILPKEKAKEKEEQ
jgi:hypothetical protein